MSCLRKRVTPGYCIVISAVAIPVPYSINCNSVCCIPTHHEVGSSRCTNAGDLAKEERLRQRERHRLRHRRRDCERIVLPLLFFRVRTWLIACFMLSEIDGLDFFFTSIKFRAGKFTTYFYFFFLFNLVLCFEIVG